MQSHFVSANSLLICRKLGRDIETARLKRRWTREQLAQRGNMSIATLAKIIAGDPGVSFGRYVQILVVLGARSRLEQLIAEDKDDIALSIERANLPKRIKRNA